MSDAHMMQFFRFDHLPEDLASVARPFCELASNMFATLPANPQRTFCLQGLLAAKDAALRASAGDRFDEFGEPIPPPWT